VDEKTQKSLQSDKAKAKAIEAKSNQAEERKKKRKKNEGCSNDCSETKN